MWWQSLPSLLNPVVVRRKEPADPRELDRHRLRLAYALIVIQFGVYLAYTASGIITLSGDEAYQWIWSKHLALSYYSKPPFIALTQFLGTHIWGDTVLGVRFFAPVLATITALVVVRFLSRVANNRVGSGADAQLTKPELHRVVEVADRLLKQAGHRGLTTRPQSAAELASAGSGN